MERVSCWWIPCLGSFIMARWRQAVEVAMTEEEIETLTALSRSRTEPASRVSRAAMLLAYREKASFFGVRQGQGARPSARTVDDAAAGAPCARARTWGRTSMSLPSGSGHGVQASRPRGNQAAQGALLSGASRRRVRAENGGGSVCLSRGSGPEKGRSQVEEIEEAGDDRLLRRKAGNPGHRDDGAGFAAGARRPSGLCARF